MTDTTPTPTACPCNPATGTYRLGIEDGTPYLLHDACGLHMGGDWATDALQLDPIPVTVAWHAEVVGDEQIVESWPVATPTDAVRDAWRVEDERDEWVGRCARIRTAWHAARLSRLRLRARVAELDTALRRAHGEGLLAAAVIVGHAADEMRAADGTWPEEWSSREVRDAVHAAARRIRDAHAAAAPAGAEEPQP